MRGLERVVVALALVVAVLVGLFLLLDGLGYAERLGVEGRLRDQSIGEGQAQYAGDAGGDAEEEKVPVETGRLS